MGKSAEGEKGDKKGMDLSSMTLGNSYALQVMLHYTEYGELVIFSS